MHLTHLTDQALLNDTRMLVSKEREMTTRLLHHLKEIDRRKLYSDLGYSSLFDYCLRELRYSEGTANRRIRAARALNELPEIQVIIEKGDINLSTLNQALNFFNQQDIESKEEKLEIIGKIKDLSQKEAEKELIIISGKDAPPPKNTMKRLSKNFIRIHLSLEESIVEAFEELKNIFGREKSMSELFDFMIKNSIHELEKKKFKVHKSSKNIPPTVAETRVISAAVKRKVYLRDHKKCAKCGSTHRLQYDHCFPFGLGGKSSEENLRLLCFNCNQRARMKAKL